MFKSIYSFSVKALFGAAVMFFSLACEDPYLEMTVKGRVCNEEGEPLNNIELHAFYTDTTLVNVSDSLPPDTSFYTENIGRAFSDANGDYVIFDSHVECSVPHNICVTATDKSGVYENALFNDPKSSKIKPGSHEGRAKFKGGFSCTCNFVLKKNKNTEK